MTPEQKRALALAMARKRRAEASAQPETRATQQAEAGTLYTPQNADLFPQQAQGAKVNASDPVQGDPTPMTAIADNVVGLDNGQMSRGEKLGTALNNAGESMTLGIVGDEAAGLADAMTGRGGYAERRDFYRKNQEQFAEENPVLSFGSEVAPAFIPGAGGAAIASKMATRLGRTGAAAAMGAGAGATQAFMEGEGGAGQRADSAKTGMVLGGLFGAAAPKVADALAGLPKGVSRAIGRSEKRPTIENLEAAKRATYRAVDQSGETFSGDDMADLFDRTRAAFEADNYVEEVDDAARATLRILERRKGQETTITQLDNIRKNLWGRYAGAKSQPVILDAIKEIDDLIGSRAETSDLMRAARAANSRYAKSKLLEDAFTKAEDQAASTGSGGNILNKYRQAVTRIINDPKKTRFFDQEEIDLMRSFVRGNINENAKRLIGKLSPSGNGLMMALHIVGGMSSGGATLPLMGVGAVAKKSADRSVEKGAQQIQDVLSGFTPAPQPSQMTPVLSGSSTAAGYLGGQQAPAARRKLYPTR